MMTITCDNTVYFEPCQKIILKPTYDIAKETVWSFGRVRVRLYESCLHVLQIITQIIHA